MHCPAGKGLGFFFFFFFKCDYFVISEAKRNLQSASNTAWLTQFNPKRGLCFLIKNFWGGGRGVGGGKGWQKYYNIALQ